MLSSRVSKARSVGTLPLPRNSLDRPQVVLHGTWNRQAEANRVITRGLIIPTRVCCDVCQKAHGPNFMDKAHAEQWLADWDEDFEEYGRFSENVPRVSEVYHKIGNKLHCIECLDKAITKTKRQA